MPVVATPVTPKLLNRDDIRMFMRDVAGQVPNTGVENILLDNVEFSDDDVEKAIRFTVDRYNAYTPMTNITEEGLNRYVLLNGVVCHLLKSEAVRQIRNQATAQQGDVAPIGIDDKMNPYVQLSQIFCVEFDTMAKQIKLQRNMEAAYGGLGSGYQNTARRAGSGGCGC